MERKDVRKKFGRTIYQAPLSEISEADAAKLSVAAIDRVSWRCAFIELENASDVRFLSHGTDVGARRVLSTSLDSDAIEQN